MIRSTLLALTLSLCITALAVGATATPATAQLQRVPPSIWKYDCYYTYSLDVLTTTPRVIAERFRKVTAKIYVRMIKRTRRSVRYPKYDKIWSGTDVATKHIDHAMVLGVRCSKYEGDDQARRDLVRLAKRLSAPRRRIKRDTKIAPNESVAQMSFKLSDDKKTIYASGMITRKTYRKFQHFITSNDLNSANQSKIREGTTVVLNSPGGHIEPALRIGLMIRKLGWRTRVAGGDRCASACAYLFMSGKARRVDETARIGVHQFWYRAKHLSPQQLNTEIYKRAQIHFSFLLFYVRKMGISSQTLELAGKTEPQRISWLTRQQITKWNIEKRAVLSPRSADPDENRLLALPLKAGPQRRCNGYRIVRVPHWDHLNLRHIPDARLGKILEKVPPNAAGVSAAGPCSNGWCPVKYGGLSGYLSQYYLDRDQKVCTAVADYRMYGSFSVVRVRNDDVLNLRDGPTRHSSRLSSLRPNERGVQISHCTTQDDGEWCFVRQGAAHSEKRRFGWARKSYLSGDFGSIPGIQRFSGRK